MSAPRQCNHPVRVKGRCLVCRRASARLRKRRLNAAKRRPAVQTADAAWDRKQSAKLSDAYVRQLLSEDNTMPPSYWPPYLVELKRLVLQMQREWIWNRAY